MSGLEGLLQTLARRALRPFAGTLATRACHDATPSTIEQEAGFRVQAALDWVTVIIQVGLVGRLIPSTRMALRPSFRATLLTCPGDIRRIQDSTAVPPPPEPILGTQPDHEAVIIRGHLAMYVGSKRERRSRCCAGRHSIRPLRYQARSPPQCRCSCSATFCWQRCST